MSGIFIILAPLLITASNSLQRKSRSLLVASMAENSTMSVYLRLLFTASFASSITSSLLFFSWYCRWISDEDMKVCITGCSAPFRASPAASISLRFALASAAIFLSLILPDISFTDLKSPLDDIGKPASIISAFNLESCSAISNFSFVFR